MLGGMKKLSATLLLSSLLATGCAMHYDVTLYNGSTLRVPSKPKLNDRGYYVFKDSNGRLVEINSMRVRKIEAVTPGDPPSKDFN
jgi:hypothetical protein